MEDGENISQIQGRCEVCIWSFYLDSEKGKPLKRAGCKATDLRLGVGLRCVGCKARIAGLPKSWYLFVWFGFFLLGEISEDHQRMDDGFSAKGGVL